MMLRKVSCFYVDVKLRSDSDKSVQLNFVKYIQLLFKRALWVTGHGHEGT